MSNPKFRVIIATTLMAFVLLAVALADTAKQTTPDKKMKLIKHGEYLATLMGCNDCHTPKNFGPNGPTLDNSRILSGCRSDWKIPEVPKGVIGFDKWGAICNNDLTAWVGPWGISFAANLTPDSVTGLGTWTAEVFKKTLRTGKHMGTGRDILPPMPWQDFQVISDEDGDALFAYLQSLKPVSNQVPLPVPPAK